MKYWVYRILAFTVAWSVLQGATATEPRRPIDEQRVRTIAEMLPESPTGFGRPISDRAAWERFVGTPFHREVVQRAEQLIGAEIPDLPDELYLDFSRTGNRRRYEQVYGNRYARLKWLALAECLENQGRFLPDLSAVIRALGGQRTWVYPAHDRDLANFRGERVDIDLFSSQIGAELATIQYLLGDRLAENVRHVIEENVRARILIPFEDMAKGKREPAWWFRGVNNWNAVCLAGVTVSALTMLDARSERAFYVAAAERYSENFLKGFAGDGYCSEGINYWVYGFGHYVLLAESIYQATGGGVALQDRAEAVRPARYGFEIEIINGIYPPFSDCAINARTNPSMMHYLNRRLGFGYAQWEPTETAGTSQALCHSLMYAFDNSASTRPAAGERVRGLGSRSWFEQAGVLICRPGENETCRVGVALKGGHNAEEHNHNDVGSYVVAAGKEILLIDPGAEVYTARTFSARRYESKLINSYGHPVPVVAGALQRRGREAHGRLLRTEFTDDVDTVVFDISSAYDVPGLQKLERTFVYSRGEGGSFSVTDEVAFSEEQNFETALITTRPHEVLPDGSVRISGEHEAVRIMIDVQGGVYEILPERIEEDIPTPPLPTRLAIRLARPVTRARVTVRIVPEG